MGRFCEGLGTSSIGQASWSFQTLDFASGTKRNSCHPLLSLSYVSGSLQRARHVMGHPNITSLLDDHFHPECNDRLAWMYQSRTTHRDTLICFDKQMIIFSRVDGAQLYSLSISQIHLGFTNLEILFNESQSQTSAVADGAVLIPRAVYKHSNSWGGSGYRILDQKFASGTFSLSPLWQSVIQPNPTLQVHASGSDLVVLLRSAQMVIIRNLQSIIRGEMALSDTALDVDLFQISRSDLNTLPSLTVRNGKVVIATVSIRPSYISVKLLSDFQDYCNCS